MGSQTSSSGLLDVFRLVKSRSANVRAQHLNSKLRGKELPRARIISIYNIYSHLEL